MRTPRNVHVVIQLLWEPHFDFMYVPNIYVKFQMSLTGLLLCVLWGTFMI
jgi:hypothetical protein